MLHAHPTAAFHHAHLLQGIIRILLAAPTFPSPSTLITVSAPTKAGTPNTNPSFSRASAAAVHLLSEIFRRILCKYATDAAVQSERNGRAKLSWDDVVHVLEEIGGGEAVEELLEWCVSRGTAGADQAAAEDASLQRPRITAPAHADDHERQNLEFHFTSLPKSLVETRELLDERDQEAREVAALFKAGLDPESEDDESVVDSMSDSESHWHLTLLREAERDFVEEVESHEHLHPESEPAAVTMDIEADEDSQRKDPPLPQREGDAAQDTQMDLDEEADQLRADAEMETAGPEAGPSKPINELPAVPQPPKSRHRRNRMPPIPVDPSLSSEANSFLTPAATINGSSTDPALLHMGQQRRNIALVLSDPQRFAPSASLYAVTPPARSGSEPGGLPFVPGPSLLITLPRSGAQSAAPFFTPVHPYGRAAGGAGAPPGGSLSTQYRNNSDLFLAARTVCEPSLLRRATRTEDPAPLLDESFAERVFQGWPAEKDLLEQAALGRGLLAPAVRVLKRQKEVKRMEEGGSRKKKKKRKILVGPSSATAKGKGKASAAGAGSKRGGRGGSKAGGRAPVSNRPGKGKTRSIYVDDYDEDEFDEYLDDPAANGMDDDEEGGYGPRGALPTPRRAYEEEEDDSEDEDLKPPESGMLVHTWDWQNRDYTEGALPMQRVRGQPRSDGPGPGGSMAGGSLAEAEAGRSTAEKSGASAATPSGAAAPVDSLLSAEPITTSVNGGEDATVIRSASLVQSPASVEAPADPIAALSPAASSSSPTTLEVTMAIPAVESAPTAASTETPTDALHAQSMVGALEPTTANFPASVPSSGSTELHTESMQIEPAKAGEVAKPSAEVAPPAQLPSLSTLTAAAADSSESATLVAPSSTVLDSSQASDHGAISASTKGNLVDELLGPSEVSSTRVDGSIDNVAANVPSTTEEQVRKSNEAQQ